MVRCKVLFSNCEPASFERPAIVKPLTLAGLIYSSLPEGKERERAMF